MAACSVLRCSNDAARSITVSSGPRKLRVDVAVCAEHGATIDTGEPFIYEPEDNNLRMGQDLPRRIVNWVTTEGPGEEIELRFIGRTHDGAEQDFDFFLSRQEAFKLGDWLRRISRISRE